MKVETSAFFHHNSFYEEWLCTCRKPAPGLLLRAAKELAIDLEDSYLVGDRLTDLECARAAGCTGLLLSRPDLHCYESAVRAADWNEALDGILECEPWRGERI